MFGAEDFFDKNQIKKPYRDAKEHLQDYAAFLDLILERTAGQLMKSSGRIYRPGIMMREADVEEFYEIPPLERRGSAYDPDLAKELKSALYHIRSREDATVNVKLPLLQLREEFSLSLFEELSILLPLGLSMNINVRNIYAYIANDVTLKHPTTGVLYSIYQLMDENGSLQLVEELSDKLGKMSVFFFRPFESGADKKSILEIPLLLRGDVLSFLLSEDITRNPVPYGISYHGDIEGPEIYKELTAQSINSEGFVYIASDDPDDVPQYLSSRNESRVLILDGDSLISDVKNSKTIYSSGVIAHALGAFFLRVRLMGETVCIRLTRPDDRLCELVFNMIKKFLPGKTIFVYGEDSLPIQFLSASYNISSIKLPLPDVEVRDSIWRYFLQKEDITLSEDINISDLADCYELSFSKIRYAVSETAKKARWNGKSIIESSELKEQLRHMGEAGLKELAVYIPPVYSMDDLQVDEIQKRIIATACNRFKIRNRVEKKYGIRRSGAYGNGVSVLLCGPPGTGKTMAAQVISKELSLPLYRVDLSQIISKYIGETQKNLNEIFEQTKKTNVILFFDEADALFAKRTDVNDSNDKYANAETAYLLQKVEGHSGMTILATNLVANFDTAFIRRITYVVKIQKPDKETRLSLWKSILPDAVPLAPDIDYEFFAENFDLSGSNIKAVLYGAMYMAAAEDRPIGNGDIVRSIRLRSEKLGSVNDPGEFGKYASYLF